jgi:hypothetical protein
MIADSLVLSPDTFTFDGIERRTGAWEQGWRQFGETSTVRCVVLNPLADPRTPAVHGKEEQLMHLIQRVGCSTHARVMHVLTSRGWAFSATAFDASINIRRFRSSAGVRIRSSEIISGLNMHAFPRVLRCPQVLSSKRNPLTGVSVIARRWQWKGVAFWVLLTLPPPTVHTGHPQIRL